MGKTRFEEIMTGEDYQRHFEETRAQLKDAGLMELRLNIAKNRALILSSLRFLYEIEIKLDVFTQKVDAFKDVQKRMIEKFVATLEAKQDFDEKVKTAVEIYLKAQGIDKSKLH